MKTDHDSNDRYGYRKDPSVPTFPDDHPIIIFDGHCVLCSRFARFVLRHDTQAVFRLMAAQSPVGQALYQHLRLSPVTFGTNVLLQDGQAWFKSAGTIRMFAQLKFPWSLCAVLKIVPPPTDGGVLFGTTVLSEQVRKNALARPFMWLMNRLGVFNNRHDNVSELKESLAAHFQVLQFELAGVTALFAVKNNLAPAIVEVDPELLVTTVPAV
jgi:predicted DCC family thiol-disulfide oxidoreductase YuxK